MQTLTFDNVIDKTPAQIQRLLIARIKAHSSTTGTKQVAIMRDIETLLYMNKLTQAEWDSCADLVGSVEQWGWAALDGDSYQTPEAKRRFYLRSEGKDTHLQGELISSTGCDSSITAAGQPNQTPPTQAQPKPDNGHGGVREGAGRATQARAAMHHMNVLPTVRHKHMDGWTLQRIADYVNELGYRTQTGERYSRMQISRLIKRDLRDGWN